MLSFSHIALGTNDIEENAENLWGNCGDIIGWCPRTNEAAGSDATRGIYNKIESYEEFINGFYHAHMVYDFGTSQGNGTFNSVWWGKNVNDINSVKIPPFTLQQFRVLGPKREYHQTNSETYYYKCVNNSYYIRAAETNRTYKKLKNPDLYINGVEEAKYFEEEIITDERSLPLAYNQFADGSYVTLENVQYKYEYPRNNPLCKFDIIHKDKNNQVISKKSIDFKVDFKDSWDYLISTTTGEQIGFDPRRIIKVLENGDVYICIRWQRNYYARRNCNYYDPATDTLKQSTTVDNGAILGIYNIKTGLWTLRFSMTDIESMRLQATPDIYQKMGEVLIDDKIVSYSYNWGNSPFRIYTDNKSMPYRFDELQISLPKISNNTNFNYWRLGCNIHNTLAFMNYTKSYSNSAEYSMGDFEIRHGYSAHTKLPNPVTKTSADTMKIVYDYYIQVPKTIDKDEDYLTYRDIDGNPIENTIS